MTPARRIIASARAIALAHGPEAGESFARGWPGWSKYAEPDWWEHTYEHESPLVLPVLDVDDSPNFTVRVRTDDGRVLWESDPP